jgi:sugar lactone lactonase YvrE
MGYYIETPLPLAKAIQLEELHGAEPYTGTFTDIPPDKVAVVVVQNGLFDAAGICFDVDEWAAFTADPNDDRPKDVLVLDKDKAIELCPEVEAELEGVV